MYSELDGTGALSLGAQSWACHTYFRSFIKMKRTVSIKSASRFLPVVSSCSVCTDSITSPITNNGKREMWNQQECAARRRNKKSEKNFFIFFTFCFVLLFFFFLFFPVLTFFFFAVFHPPASLFLFVFFFFSFSSIVWIIWWYVIQFSPRKCMQVCKSDKQKIGKSFWSMIFIDNKYCSYHLFAEEI